jgi:hypothetical protein
MKKLLLLSLVAFIAFQVKAQEDIVITGSKKINKKLTPQQVIDSLEKKFPDAKSVKYYKAPASGVDNGWAVTEEDNISTDASVEYYTISFKRDDLQYYGLYAPDGTLVQAKIQQKVEELPAAIKTSLTKLSESYPGYKIVSKNYYKKLNYSKSKEYYEVVAKKDKETKTLYYDPDGTLVKVK